MRGKRGNKMAAIEEREAAAGKPLAARETVIYRMMSKGVDNKRGNHHTKVCRKIADEPVRCVNCAGE